MIEEKILYTNDLRRKGTENPFDLNLVNENGTLAKFYQINIKGELIKELTLKDLISSQIISVENASSDHYAQNASSDNGAPNASSGHYVHNSSSGSFSHNLSSGDYTHNANSGDYACNASSGDCSYSANSGYGTRNASSGDYTHNANSGNDALNTSSGDYAQNANSGNGVQDVSSGDYVHNASSGNYTVHEIMGKYSTIFANGCNSLIKAVKGTWIALQEYNDNREPIFAKVGQIGRHKDFQGNVLKEDYYYSLIRKQFVPVIIVDNIQTIVFSKKEIGNKIIYLGSLVDDYRVDKDADKIYIVKIDGVSAHGKTIKEAVADIDFKLAKSRSVEETIKKVKETNKVSANDYRIITGACQFGTENFAKRKGLTITDTKTIDEIIELTIGEYGHDTFVRLVKENRL